MSAANGAPPPATGDEQHFRYEPDPAMPGWMTWEVRDHTRFNAVFGALRVRRDPDGRGRLRMWPQPIHGNIAGALHGGVLMSLIDVALFVTCRVNDIFPVGRASTVDCNVQFVAAGRLDRPVDAVGEVLRETGRLVFLRGLVVQGEGAEETICCAFSGTVRKPPRGG